MTGADDSSSPAEETDADSGAIDSTEVSGSGPTGATDASGSDPTDATGSDPTDATGSDPTDATDATGSGPADVTGASPSGTPDPVRSRPSLRRDLRHARRVATVELRRSVRNARTETNVLIGLGLLALIGYGGALLAAAGLLAVGPELREPGSGGRQLLRVGVVSAWLFGALMVGFRVVGETGRIDGEAGILTATSPRAVVLGLVLAEVGRFAANLGGPLLIVVAGVAFGVGPIVAGAFVATAVAVLLLSVPAGYLAGMLALYLSTTVAFVRRNRLALAGVFFVAYLGVIVAFGQFSAALAATPLGWLGDPLLVALGAGGSPVRAGVALAAPLVGAPLALAGAHRLAVATWYADVAEDGGGGDAGTAVAGVDALLAPVVSRPTASVARKTLLRARRAPYTLTFALIPAFAFVGYVAQAIQRGEVGGLLPVMAAGYAGWGVGAAFTLNPFGEEGALLPVTLTTGVSGDQFVRGRVLAAWLLAVPVVAAIALVAAVASMPAWQAAGAVAFAVVFCPTAPLVASGIGAAFPKFDARKVLGSREAVIPSVFAFGAFSLALLPLGLPAVVGLLAGGLAPDAGLSPLVVALAGVGITGVCSLVAGGVSYWWATRTFDGYSLS